MHKRSAEHVYLVRERIYAEIYPFLIITRIKKISSDEKINAFLKPEYRGTEEF